MNMTIQQYPIQSNKLVNDQSNLINVLDKGFVRLVGSFGGDLQVVNAARISYLKQKTVMDLSDEKLIHFLADMRHESPFRHVTISLHVKMPITVKNQLWKSIIGAEWTTEYCKGMGWNEVSRRFTKENVEIHTPTHFRGQSKSNKQCSNGQIIANSPVLVNEWRDLCQKNYEFYQKLLNLGVAREMARGILPLDTYTEVYITLSLQALVNLYKLRTHSGAQWEIQQYAQAMGALCRDIAPVSWAALMKDRTPKPPTWTDMFDSFKQKFLKYIGYTK